MSQKLLNTINKILHADKKSLKSPVFLIKIIRETGLTFDNRHPYHKSDMPFMNHNVKMGGLYQKPNEFARFLIYLSTQDIKTIIDIGTYSGFTFSIMCAYLSKFNSNLTAIGVDPEHWFVHYEKVKELLPFITYEHTVSGNYCGVPFDLCFIDGNHEYNFVKGDYENVGKYAKICAFHDVCDHVCVSIRQVVNEMKDGKEYIEFCSEPKNWMGIGVLINKIHLSNIDTPMYPHSYKVVSVCPAGRIETMKLLSYYLLKNNSIIDKHIWWVNTAHQPDINFMVNISKKYPNFFSVIHDPAPVEGALNYRIHVFYKYCQDEDTIYIRVDDDVVWMAPDAISNMVKFRVEDPRPLIVYGNVINNTICNHIHQRLGTIPYHGEFIGYGRMDEKSFKAGNLAHESFFEKLEAQSLDDYKFKQWIMHPFEGGYSINSICWFGKDMKSIEGRVGADEEVYLTVDLPRATGRYNATCGKALFSHYCYKPQKDWNVLNKNILSKYVKLVENDPLYKEIDAIPTV